MIRTLIDFAASAACNVIEGPELRQKVRDLETALRISLANHGTKGREIDRLREDAETQRTTARSNYQRVNEERSALKAELATLTRKVAKETEDQKRYIRTTSKTVETQTEKIHQLIDMCKVQAVEVDDQATQIKTLEAELAVYRAGGLVLGEPVDTMNAQLEALGMLGAGHK